MTRIVSRSIVCFFAALLAIAPAVLAYETPLEPESIRWAYFLGKRSDEKTASLLADYMKRLPVPERDPYISEMTLYAFRTGYPRLVE